ncbi:MAG: NAD(+)/NADH kinase [Polyangiales bacterium]
MSARRVLVVAKRSSYKRYVEEAHDPRVESLLASGDPTVKRMLPAHHDHEHTLDEVRTALHALRIDAAFDENPRTPDGDERFDLVVTVGGDGTLLAASHHVGADTPVLGVNSSPDHSVGFFCAAKKGTVRHTLEGALTGKLRRVSLARMRVDLNGVCLDRRVLNEALFCHASPAATSRYILRITQPDGTTEEEEQKSSGLWIGPAAGSTAAQRSAGGRVLPLASTKIQYVVREPYAPHGHRMRLTLGLVDDGGTLALRNKMRQAKLFLDGEHTLHDVAMGDVVTMRRSEEFLTVLGLSRNGEGRAPRKAR